MQLPQGKRIRRDFVFPDEARYFSRHRPMHFNDSSRTRVIRDTRACSRVTVHGTGSKCTGVTKAKHRLMNAYGRLFGTKVLSLLYIKHE